MSLTTPSRRRFLFGAGVLLAAPAIVRVASLMPVSPLPTAELTHAFGGPGETREFRPLHIP